jgi:hypothetical protein
MNLTNERKLAARAKELGESASAGAFAELASLAASESPLVRRLAASAVGKLAGIADSAASIDTEYWGMDTPRYKAGMYLKQDLYMQAGKRLISLYPEDKLHLDMALGEKLKQIKD